MKISINSAYAFEREFANHGRDNQFSYEALGVLFDYFDEFDPDMELDVIAICCEYTEDSIESIARSYSINMNDADPEDDDYEEQCKEIVLNYLNDHTSVIGETDSGIVYANF